MLFSCGGSEEDGPSSTPDPVNTAPTVPVQVYPTDNLLCIDNLLDFSWNSSSDKENDNISYEIQVATNNIFTNGLQTRTLDQTSTTFSLNTGAAYYWRIRARDSKGEISDYSAISKFYTEGEGISNYLPFSPTLVSPLLSSTLNEVSTKLEWTASDVDNDTLVYDIYFGNNYPPDLVDLDVENNNYTVNLNSGTIYYWKIVVKDNKGGKAIGQIWSFQTY